jgi:Tol biopolymer transport system component
MDASGDSRTAVQLTTGMADGRAGLVPLPDGRVGYIARAGDSLNIWTMGADGSNRKQITSEPPTAEELRATPDGRFFIFSAAAESGGAQLFRIDTEGRGMVQLTNENGNAIDSSVSPDGKWLVYHYTSFVDGQHRGLLKKIPLEGGEPIVLSSDGCGMPHYSPDGRYISCVYFDKSILAVISADDGAPVAKFDTVKRPLINSGVRWTPDGKGLVYMVDQKKSTNLWVQPLGGSEPRPLTDFSSGGMYNFAFAADGSRLYVARGYEYRDAVLIKNVR